MKKISLSDYKSNMGVFIDVNYNNSNVVSNAIHIPYEQLLINHILFIVMEELSQRK